MHNEDDQPVPGDPPKEYDRRRGPRRGLSDQAVGEERRRSGDRRNVPGLSALVDAILGIRRIKPPDEPKENPD